MAITSSQCPHLTYLCVRIFSLATYLMVCHSSSSILREFSFGDCRQRSFISLQEISKDRVTEREISVIERLLS